MSIKYYIFKLSALEVYRKIQGEDITPANIGQSFLLNNTDKKHFYSNIQCRLLSSRSPQNCFQTDCDTTCHELFDTGWRAEVSAKNKNGMPQVRMIINSELIYFIVLFFFSFFFSKSRPSKLRILWPVCIDDCLSH